MYIMMLRKISSCFFDYCIQSYSSDKKMGNVSS